jgi:hypothetical protein
MITGESKSKTDELTAAGVVDACHFYEALTAEVAPDGPAMIFRDEDLEGLFEAMQQVAQRAEG